MRYLVIRDVTPEECDWLPTTVTKGTVVTRCVMATYGCVTPSGEAVTFNDEGDYPFFELPLDALMKEPA